MTGRRSNSDKYRDIFSCRGKVAVVTGGCGLIGKELVKALVTFGAKVYIADIDGKELRSFADSVGGAPLPFDISDERSVKGAFDKIRRLHNRLDILVNCAYPRTGDWNSKLEDTPWNSWKKNCNDHLGGYFLSSKEAAEMMKKQKSGVIINFGSIYGMLGPDFDIYKNTSMTMPVAYSAIKGGIISLTRYLATYYGRYNVRANVISPGGVLNGQKNCFVKKYTKKTPLGRMAKPQDMVGAVLFLSSDASSYVTGCNLVVDGGWSAW